MIVCCDAPATGSGTWRAADGRLAWDEPVSAPGSYVRLRAEMDPIVAFSAAHFAIE